MEREDYEHVDFTFAWFMFSHNYRLEGFLFFFNYNAVFTQTKMIRTEKKKKKDQSIEYIKSIFFNTIFLFL